MGREPIPTTGLIKCKNFRFINTHLALARHSFVESRKGERERESSASAYSAKRLIGPCGTVAHCPFDSAALHIEDNYSAATEYGLVILDWIIVMSS